MRLSPKSRAIISNTRRGPVTSLIRSLLAVAASFYALIIVLRNKLYDRGWLKSHKLSVPVVCVGNITAGGTGKTPMVIWLCRFFLARDIKPAILSRGYKADDEDGNDEIQLLRRTLPDVPVVIDSDRLRGGRTALADHQAQVLIMDDGFQHRRLRRDLDIVMIDCTCPFGYDYLLPRGLLREPKTQLHRADIAILSRCDLIEQNKLDELTRQIQQILDNTALTDKATPKIIAHSRYEPNALFTSDGEKNDLDRLRGKKVLAFCGIGNPLAFVATLRKLEIEVVREHIFDDHHCYTEQDCKFLRAIFTENDYDAMVTTEKDWVKIKQLSAAQMLKNLYWLKIETVLTHNREQLEDRLDQICRNINQD